MEEKNKKNDRAPETTQDERAPQDENPMTTPHKSNGNFGKTLNDRSNRNLSRKKKTKE